MAESFIQLNNDGPGKQVDTWTEATSGHHRQAMVLADPSVTANVAFITAANALKVDASATTQPISGSITVLNASLPVTQSGTWNIGTLTSITNSVAVTGTFFQATQPVSVASLPLPSGASTSANQSTEITALNTLVTNTPPVGQATMANSSPVVIASNQSAVPISGTVTANAGTGTLNVSVQNASIPVTESGTWTVQPGNTANTTPWLTTINQGGNSAIVNATGELLATDTDLTNTQGSTTSGQLGPLVQGAVTTAAPAYTTAQTNPLSLTTVGNLRVDGSSVTQPVSGTVTANAGTGTFTVSGTVTANQGTANATPWNENLAQVGGSAITLGSKLSASSVPVVLSSDQQLFASQASSLCQSATAATGVGVTVTLPAVAAQFHYISLIQIKKYFTAANAASATPLVVTTTNLPGSLAFTFGQPLGTIGTTDEDIFTPEAALKSSVVNTATTIVAPATTGIIWRINVFYFAAS